MSHEKLRFNIILKESRSKDNNSEKFPTPIYSDVKYGTHYGLYALFNGVCDKNNHETLFTVKNMHYYVQNYTGEVTLGISNVLGVNIVPMPIEYRLTNSDEKGRLIKIYICMKGLSNHFIDEITHEEINDELILSNNDIIEVISVFEPINNEYSRIDDPENRNQKCIFADSEFMFRDGEEIKFIEERQEFLDLLRRIQSRGFAINDGQGEELGLENKNHGFGGDKFCKMKVSNIHLI